MQRQFERPAAAGVRPLLATVGLATALSWATWGAGMASIEGLTGLQERMRRVVTAVVVGLVWAFWHLPAFRFADFRNGLELPLFAVLNTLTTDLLRENWWDLGRLGPAKIYLLILGVFALTAGAAELLDRTALHRPEPRA